MSLGTTNRDGGKTSESGHLRAIAKSFVGEVLTGLAVSQRGAGANMSVDIAIGDAIIPRSDGTYGHPAFNDAVLNQVIATADPSNPRRDILVMYIDYGNAVSTAVSNNTNGVVKVKVVAGTPAGSPVDPTDSAIQTSVASGNPFIKLARIRVGAGVGSIGTSVIDDLRTMAQALDNGGWTPVSSAWDYWTYASATTITVPTDATTKHEQGQFVRFYQTTGGWKYAQISAVTATLLTLIMATGQTLANERIYLPAYSYARRPFGLPNSLPLGEIVQTATFTTGAMATGTTTIPGDDTIPQNTEGDQYMSMVFTPKAATNRLSIRVKLNLSSSAAAIDLVCAIFQDSIVNALAAGWATQGGTTYKNIATIEYDGVAGGVAPITFKVRGGTVTPSTVTFNGQSASRLLGGAYISSINIIEYRA